MTMSSWCLRGCISRSPTFIAKLSSSSSSSSVDQEDPKAADDDTRQLKTSSQWKDEALFVGFGRKGHAVGDISGFQGDGKSGETCLWLCRIMRGQNFRCCLRMTNATEPPFAPRDRLQKYQQIFQTTQKHTYLKGRFDKITSIAIPLALAGSSLFLIGRRIYNMSHGIGKKE